MNQILFKIVTESQWSAAVPAQSFNGAPIDLADGYVHLSTAAQVRETAARHFAGAESLLIIAVKSEPLGAALKFEPSRGGDLFPHLYAALDFSAVAWVKPLPLGADGLHVFPDLAA